MASPKRLAVHDVAGHDALRASLAAAVSRERLPPTILLHGARGVGKQRLALWLAQVVLCGGRSSNGPCDHCQACRLARRIEHPDLHWYFPLSRPSGARSPQKLAEALEAARADALEEVRARPIRAPRRSDVEAIYLAMAQSLRRRAMKRPSMGPRQVFIIADAEKLVPQEASPEAANALLKLLEEPPEGSIFVLTSSEPGLLLPTIRSRALPIYVAGLDLETVESFLVDVAGVEPEVARGAARASQGSIGRGLGYLPAEGGGPGSLEALCVDSLAILEAALSSDGSAFRRGLDQAPWGARGLADLFASLEEWLRDLSAVAASVPGAVSNPGRAQTLQKMISRDKLDPLAPINALDSVEEARIAARRNVNPQLLVSGLIEELRATLRPAATTPAST